MSWRQVSSTVSDEYLKDLTNSLNYDFPKSSGPASMIAESIQGIDELFAMCSSRNKRLS